MELPGLVTPPAEPPLTRAVERAGTLLTAAGAARTRPGTSAPPRGGVVALVGLGLASLGTALALAGVRPVAAGARLVVAVAGVAPTGPGPVAAAARLARAVVRPLVAAPAFALADARLALAGALPAGAGAGSALAGAGLAPAGTGLADLPTWPADPVAGAPEARPMRGCLEPPGPAAWPLPAGRSAVGRLGDVNWPSGAVDRRPGAVGSRWVVGESTGAPADVPSTAAWDADRPAALGCAPGMLLPPGWAIAFALLPGALAAAPEAPPGACAPRPWYCRPGIIAPPAWPAVGAVAAGAVRCGGCAGSPLGRAAWPLGAASR